MRGVAQRADARRNREVLIAAAEEVFAVDGVDVPLDAVARRAGLGRGTLYRHFPDRQALAVAVYGRRLAGLEAVAEHHRDDPKLLERLVFGVADRQMRVPGLVGVLSATAEGRAALAAISDRTRALVAGPLAAARARGDVRPDVTPDDLMLLFGMVDGLARNLPPGEAEPSVRRGCRLVLDGLRPTSARRS
jgi:AcrR family transcriptional regulator